MDSRILDRFEARSGDANRVVSWREQVESVHTVGKSDAIAEGAGCLIGKPDLGGGDAEPAGVYHAAGEDGSLVLREGRAGAYAEGDDEDETGLWHFGSSG